MKIGMAMTMKNMLSAAAVFWGLVLFYHSTYGQAVNPQFLPVITNDGEEIPSVITQLNQAIAQNDKSRFPRLFTNPSRAAQMFCAVWFLRNSLGDT